MEAWLPLGAKGAGAEVGAGERWVGANKRKLLSAGSCFWKEFSREARSKLLAINMARAHSFSAFTAPAQWIKCCSPPPLTKKKKKEPLINAASLDLLQNLELFLQLKMTKGG